MSKHFSTAIRSLPAPVRLILSLWDAAIQQAAIPCGACLLRADSIFRLAIGALLLTVATVASGGKPDNVSELELSLLPKYCLDAQFVGKYGDAYTNTSPNAPQWIAVMGKGFWAVHHYCWALLSLNRVQKPSVPTMERQLMREYAINDMNYVINNTDPNFILLPEIYTKIGEVQLLLRHPSDAGNAFAKARSLKPDYWPAYYQWADFLRSAGRKNEARELVEEGLSYSPGSKTLQTLLVDLGGDPKAIKPRETASPTTSNE
jgi:tetratricopeptide (TPR) repeat protein